MAKRTKVCDAKLKGLPSIRFDYGSQLPNEAYIKTAISFVDVIVWFMVAAFWLRCSIFAFRAIQLHRESEEKIMAIVALPMMLLGVAIGFSASFLVRR